MALEQRDLSQMLETAIVAARLAGQRAMEEIYFVSTSRKKAAGELVTQADTRCQQIIVGRIKETYPDHGFVAEEGNQDRLFKQPPRGAEPIWWAVDPIDGTNNFAHRIPVFTISIAAMHKGEPIAGVVFEPATDSMYTAVKGGEPQLNGRRIAASNEVMDEFSSVGVDSHLGKRVPKWASKIMVGTRFRCLGSTALQFAYVAKGSFIATVHSSPKLWDVAAGTLIAEMAGAVVSDWGGDKIFPVDLDAYNGQRWQIMAANKKVHGQILKLLKS